MKLATQTEIAGVEHTLQYIHCLKTQNSKALTRKQSLFICKVSLCTRVLSHFKSLRLSERDSKFSRFNYLKRNIYWYFAFFTSNNILGLEKKYFLKICWPKSPFPKKTFSITVLADTWSMISKCWSMFGDIEIYDTDKIHTILCARWKIAYCLLFSEVQAIIMMQQTFRILHKSLQTIVCLFLDNICTPLFCFIPCILVLYS